MKRAEVRKGDWVRLVDSPRFGIHAGQELLVVDMTDRWIFVECEDEHVLNVKATDLKQVRREADLSDEAARRFASYREATKGN